MDRKFLILVLIFFLLLSSFAIAVFFDSRVQQAQANVSGPVDSSQSLIILGSTQCAVNQPCEFNVFSRNADGRAVGGVPVCPSVTLGTISPACGPLTVSNELGQTTFSITSATPGIGVISATVDSTVSIGQTATIEFK